MICASLYSVQMLICHVHTGGRGGGWRYSLICFVLVVVYQGTLYWEASCFTKSIRKAECTEVPSKL